MSTSPSRAFDRTEPLPGYRTVELLGRGGFGEVWRSVAPGGLAKAVKIVYGDVDSSQAAIEMRALSRIKDVRHPLLLSIERIEVIEANLVIVTELADHSLKQRFTQCREENLAGVPQDELVGYLDDAAQVLDFLYERYSLQHLDVKPENILLISGRAKLGDFGLVKNLYERGASLVGGLTPTYAPPELFEGKPNRHSDQYSLAIVYMQMLTGVGPFVASNMAQLATQHMRAVPDLSSLPKRQRPVIARALSKDPGQRFATCGAMVAALKESLRDADRLAETRVVTPAAETAHAEPAATHAALRELPKILTGDTRRTAALAETIAAPHAGRSSAGHTPTIFVGVGGGGVEALAKLVHRLRDRFGRTEQWPAVELLALDTNTRTLTSQFCEEDLPRIQVVPIPLKTAESYGGQAAGFLRWLGRRWFYNIPRDLTTGGYRPLGRLALLTHAARVREAIAAVIARAGKHAAAEAAPGAAGRVAPRIVVVGSISGGTGGGAITDVAYALRGELKRRGLADDQVHGILLHSTPRSNADRDKARANAYAALTELHHFGRPGGHYPGEPLLESPPFHGDNAPFSRMHLLNLGSGLGSADWDLATDQTAEFLYCTSFTAARAILDGQPDDAASAASSAGLQEYDVLALGAGSGRFVSQRVRLACHDVIRLWREGRHDASGSAQSSRTLSVNGLAEFTASRSVELEPAVQQLLAENKLEFDALFGDASAVGELEVGAKAGEFIARLVDDALAATRGEPDAGARREGILRLIDRFLRCDPHSDNSSEDLLYDRILSRLVVRTGARVNGFLESVRQLVDAPELRIEGARQSAIVAQRLLQALQERVVGRAAEFHETAARSGQEVRTVESQPERSGLMGWALRKAKPDDRLREALLPYAEARLNELLARTAVKIVRIIDAELTTAVEQLNRLSRDLSLLAEPARGAEDAPAEGESEGGAAATLAAYWQMVLAELELGRSDIARHIEETIEQRLFAGQPGLRRFLDPGAEVRRTLWQPLAEASRQVVLKRIREISCRLIDHPDAGTRAAPSNDLMGLIAAAITGQPGTNAAVLGRILILPEETNLAQVRRKVQAALGNTLLLHDRRCDVTLCSIRQPASLEQTAEAIIGGIAQYKELAGRLQTRVDIRWSSLSTTEAARGDDPAEAPSEPLPAKTLLVQV